MHAVQIHSIGDSGDEPGPPEAREAPGPGDPSLATSPQLSRCRFRPEMDSIKVEVEAMVEDLEMSDAMK